MYVPRRSESTFYINVKNPEVSQGYIPRLKIGKGSCLVKVKNGRAYLQIYNTTNNEVGIKIPTLNVQEE
ncbi:Protein of unknown function [Cotesia congregata]|uniref:Uncharacterized protein n=1 Tax=Cotesia congregata TaxID=51543 RepID=A0A8J2HCN1_COTCN|nr:Protein of unknown function [Cotesia congregata]